MLNVVKHKCIDKKSALAELFTSFSSTYSTVQYAAATTSSLAAAAAATTTTTVTTSTAPEAALTSSFKHQMRNYSSGSVALFQKFKLSKSRPLSLLPADMMPASSTLPFSPSLCLPLLLLLGRRQQRKEDKQNKQKTRKRGVG